MCDANGKNPCDGVKFGFYSTKVVVVDIKIMKPKHKIVKLF